jgi:hypothetical protein
MYLMI